MGEIVYLDRPITDPNHVDALHAVLMRNLDEPMRDALIAQADNVIDLRDRCERATVRGVIGYDDAGDSPDDIA